MQNGQRMNTDQNGAGVESSPFSPPSLSLPKGGGAIRGIGEKFAANPVTGTGSMSVPGELHFKCRKNRGVASGKKWTSRHVSV